MEIGKGTKRMNLTTHNSDLSFSSSAIERSQLRELMGFHSFRVYYPYKKAKSH
jgi:hypothetical protein